LFLEFGQSAVLNLIEKMNILGSEKTTEEGEYDRELDPGGPEFTT
jgi:hypothetical protein